MARISATVVDVNPTTVNLTGDDTYFVKYHSNAKAEMDLVGDVMSLDFCLIKNDGIKVWGSSATFDSIESNKFEFSCQGASGNSYNETVNVNMINYIRLTCNITQITIDGNGNAVVKCNGNFFDGDFGAVQNTIYVACSCLDESLNFITDGVMNVTTFGSTYSASISFSGLEYDKVYTFDIFAKDKLESISTRRKSTSTPVFHWGRNDFTFEVPVKAKDIRLKTDGNNYGHYLRFGDGDYCYIAELSDDKLTIYADKGINFSTLNGEVTINGKPLSGSGCDCGYGTWYPEIETSNGENPYSTFTRSGWYSRVGNVVTIGFYIYADCYSGYDDESVIITGLPYTPNMKAAGGGACSGAYVAGGKTFQSFVAETDGIITTRTHDCENLSGSNLSTSSKGCCFPKDGGYITLIGTITYKTSEY